MSLSRLSRPCLQQLSFTAPRPVSASLRVSANSLRSQLQIQPKSPIQQIREDQVEILPPTSDQNSAPGSQYSDKQPGYEEFDIPWPKVRVRYVRPAIWSFAVAGGILSGFAYYQAKREIEQEKTSSSWLKAPQWALQSQPRGPPSPADLAKNWWAGQDPISQATWCIIGANSAVHLTSFLVPRFWELLWHVPARNVNYTNFTSMFVHSGPMHLAVNMWATYNFMLPVGHSRLFEGNALHIGSFFLATGVLSGYAQHWTTIFAKNRRIIPEIFIKGGGASGALFGILGAFCMEYPTAQLGILFLPIHFEAQYFFPAVMLFDLYGIIRGYSFVNFGHA
ncbi:hypothetical protein N0V94_007083, partial [Neodidymelliopsis sp. IMI 364377]